MRVVLALVALLCVWMADAGGTRGDERRLMEDDVDTESCPFIYDEYKIEFSKSFSFVFSPAEYGIPHGYYCGFGLEGTPLKFPKLENCTCPFASYCDEKWGVIYPFPNDRSLQVNVGRCQIYSWAVYGPLLLALGFSVCFVGMCAKRRPYKERVIIIRESNAPEYVSLD